MARRRAAAPIVWADDKHLEEVELPDGRMLRAGQEFTVRGAGRFRFRWLWTPDNSITAYGPVGKQAASWRSFPTTAAITIHRATTETRK